VFQVLQVHKVHGVHKDLPGHKVFKEEQDLQEKLGRPEILEPLDSKEIQVQQDN
jgi:hypothetical protein